MLNRDIALITKVLQNNIHFSCVDGLLGYNNKIYPSLRIALLKEIIIVIFNVEIWYCTVYININHICVHDILSIKNVSKQMKNLICKTYDGLSTNL